MIKDLRDARLVDAVPRVVAGQDWVRALSEAVGVLHERTLRYIDDSQIYTSLDTATEPVLDALAINWKVDWYDTGYSVEQKRRIIKTALTVRRLMGTVGAVKLQADAIYPGTMLEEWFEYGGQPGTFRLYINVTDTTEEHPAIIYSPAEMERRLITAKRWSAHLESLSYMVRHTLATGCRVDKWAYTVPECGTVYCGVWWMPATLGYTAHHALLTGGQPQGRQAPAILDVPSAAQAGAGLVLPETGHKQILLPGEPRKAAGDLGAAGERPRHDGVYTGRGEQQSRAVRPAALADTAGHAAGRMAVRSGYADRQPDEPTICEHLLKRA